MQTLHNTITEGVQVVDDGLVDYMLAKPGWEVAPVEYDVEDVDELRGQALDEALVAAELPRSGTADEKRARYAEWLAQQDPEHDPEHDLTEEN